MLRVGCVSVTARWFVQFFGLTELKGAIRDFQGPVVMLSTVTSVRRAGGTVCVNLAVSAKI
jgi:hypothetical protein